ncbi:MAG: CoB--CoM heterodisulfide reductase iron-sulfur subunit A family protein [Gemmatimonadota bacterium]|nr:CoB--CoM heterodisulfide reductase iron-sulfur subunit A family protein [Gemmatimonadota bacterium]MDH5198395.1 CoB--CoM heterodisulfide reductase iron-sulfur subunit A family protein [Gemmatimonadota bacterium]
MTGTPRGTILVIGGGISGITAAVEASEAGCEVVLVERQAFLGGRVARSHQYFPKMCPPHCGLEINLRRVKTNPRVRCLTLAEVEEISGGPGHYYVRIRQHPRRVNEKCTVCGACVDACPVERPDDFNLGMTSTKAIYQPYEMAFPMRLAIDEATCLGPECGKCLPACPFDAIDLTMQAATVELDVQAVIVATGWAPFDAARIAGLGFGTVPNVITNVMMERVATRTGPTGGNIVRPSDGKPVQSVAFVQCAGSRDDNYLRHCSGVCCLGSLKQARYVRAQYPEADIYIFYIDIRAPGRLEDFYAASQADERLHLIKGKVAKITEDAATGMLAVEAEDTLTGEPVRQPVDLVVLATGIVPSDTSGIRIEGGLRTDAHGFLTREQGSGGLLVAGCATRPSDVATCVRDATGAVAKALQFCTE